MLSVTVKNAQFVAPIGLYPQEAKTLNQIGVDVTVSRNCSVHELPFIDYTTLYALIRKIISKHHKTLEEIVSELYLEIKNTHPECMLDIKVRKLHPPVSGQIDHTEVRYQDQ